MNFFKRLSVNAKDKDGNAALVRAFALGDVESVTTSIAAGANLEERAKFGKRALMAAAQAC